MSTASICITSPLSSGRTWRVAGSCQRRDKAEPSARTHCYEWPELINSLFKQQLPPGNEPALASRCLRIELLAGLACDARFDYRHTYVARLLRLHIARPRRRSVQDFVFDSWPMIARAGAQLPSPSWPPRPRDLTYEPPKTLSVGLTFEADLEGTAEFDGDFALKHIVRPRTRERSGRSLRFGSPTFATPCFEAQNQN